MALVRAYRLPWDTLAGDSVTDVFIPATEFFPVAGTAQARGWLELRGRFGNALVQPAVQTANDTRSPDAAVGLKIAGGDANGFANANGVFDPDTSLANLSTVGKRVLRLGWLIKLSQAGTGGCRVTGGIELYL